MKKYFLLIFASAFLALTPTKSQAAQPHSWEQRLAFLVDKYGEQGDKRAVFKLVNRTVTGDEMIHLVDRHRAMVVLIVIGQERSIVQYGCPFPSKMGILTDQETIVNSQMKEGGRLDRLTNEWSIKWPLSYLKMAYR